MVKARARRSPGLFVVALSGSPGADRSPGALSDEGSRGSRPPSCSCEWYSRILPRRRSRAPAGHGHLSSTYSGLSGPFQHTRQRAAGHARSLHCWQLCLGDVQGGAYSSGDRLPWPARSWWTVTPRPGSPGQEHWSRHPGSLGMFEEVVGPATTSCLSESPTALTIVRMTAGTMF